MIHFCFQNDGTSKGEESCQFASQKANQDLGLREERQNVLQHKAAATHHRHVIQELRRETTAGPISRGKGHVLLLGTFPDCLRRCRCNAVTTTRFIAESTF